MTGGLRLRLAARAGLLAAVAMAGIGALVEASVVRPMVRREDSRLLSQADGLAAMVASEGAAGFRRSVGNWVRASREEWVALLGPEGRVLVSEGVVPPGAEGIAAGGDPVVIEGLAPWGERAVAREARPPDGATFRVALGLSLRGVREEQLRVRLLLAAAGLLGVALVGAGAWAGAGSVLAPLSRMTGAARRASEDPASLRMPVEAEPGEFDELSGLLNDLLSRIERTMEEERAFAGEAAHELRGPLAVLRIRAERAMAEGDGEGMREALRGMVQDCDRVGRLIQGLLELSRAPRGRGDGAPPGVVDAGALLATLAPDLETLGRVRGMRFACLPAPGPLPAASPSEILETCLSVLVDNAFRYAPPGSSVEVAAGPGEGGGVRILVIDEGPGVPAEEAERIFDRLFRGAVGRRAEGTGFGLGLPLARRLARSTGGEIRLLNPGEAGARFAIDLPPPAPVVKIPS